MNVRVYPSDEAVDEPLEFEGVTRLSFIDAESHGPATSFGIVDAFRGKALFVCTPNVAAVEVTA